MCEVMAPSHVFLEQPGKLRLLLRGQSFGDLVVEGERALSSRLCGQTKPGPSGPWVEVKINAHGREAVLAHWLNRLLYLAGRDRWAPVECQVLAASEGGLRARVRGVALGKEPCLRKAVIGPSSRIGQGPCGLQVEVILQPPLMAPRHRARRVRGARRHERS